jgi:acetylornithine/succinyldiaminopimelate/putrescine aminotransferase
MMLHSDFKKYQAQTSPEPLGIEVQSAKGSYIYDTKGKAYLDFVAGVSANVIGHQPQTLIDAVNEQLHKYMHVMVYGEFIQKPQVELTRKMAEILPGDLSVTYLVNSGTEATEGAMKLAKIYTGRAEIIAAKHSYHGNTQGAMSVMDYPERKNPFTPLIPGTRFIGFNNFDDLSKITSRTAAVILETIQGGAGFIEPQNNYLQAVKKRCNEVGALLILDEIQTGFARTGKMFGFEHYQIIPDIVITGKALGGGMPVGAFTSTPEIMKSLTRPPMGHITTFGGHPVIAAAALSTIKYLEKHQLHKEALRKEHLLRQGLKHPKITEIRGRGLMLALIMQTAEQADKLVVKALKKGLILFWLLYEKKAVRITPPLTVSDDELQKGIKIILDVLDEI